MIEVSTDNFRGRRAPLYTRYSGQTAPQPAYIEMSETGFVSADYSGDIGNGVPIEVYNGRTLTWRIPSDISGDALADFLERDDVVSLLIRIHSGHTVEWDGRNMAGKLTDDAQDANERLEYLASALNDASERTVVWEVGDWLFTSCSLSEHWSKMPLSEAVEIAEATANDDGIYLDGDVGEALLDQAEYLFKENPDQLDLIHAQTLFYEGKITQEEFSSWTEAYIS
jgi:hypothetical protein